MPGFATCCLCDDFAITLCDQLCANLMHGKVVRHRMEKSQDGKVEASQSGEILPFCSSHGKVARHGNFAAKSISGRDCPLFDWVRSVQSRGPAQIYPLTDRSKQTE